jgi:putative spermidine/putrescine transport system substrate-binding protein
MTTAQAETELVVVSWGGAYSASQQNAYHEPYMAANPDVKIINDDSSNEAVAKLRAMNEAGNVTWALVDVVASDAIRLCDEGLAEPINHDEVLAAAPDGTPASEDFGEMIVSECYIPQIVYSTTFGYRTDRSNSADLNR